MRQRALSPPLSPPLSLFITGTDTGVGKTHIACGLLRAASAQGMDACGYKPVASGCRRTNRGLRNPDALALQAAAATREPYDTLNPYAFAPAIAPHLAAREAGLRIERRRLDAAHRDLALRHSLILIEGAGGWQVPIGPRATMADWVAARGWPVILVVGMRLGCLNHALLSADAIRRTAPLLGWIASELPPRQPRLEENLADLQARMPAPMLGRVGLRRRVLDAELRAILAQTQGIARS